MKKMIKIALLIVVLAGVTFAVTEAIRQVSRKNRITAGVQHIPDFSFRQLNGDLFSTAMLEKNRSVLVVYFSPDCEHCQYEAREINKYRPQLKEAQILMVSDDPIPRIQQFDSLFLLSGNPQVKILKSEQDNFYKVFGTRAIPALFIYNKQGVLVKQFMGEANMDAILKYL